MFQSLNNIAYWLWSIWKVLRLRRPGTIFLRVTKDDEMLKFVLVLPQPGAHDVIKRQLNVQVGNGEVQSFELPGNSLESEELGGQDNDSITGSLVDIDDAGNMSESRDFQFTLTDTLAPPIPGELGVRVTEEVPDEEEDPSSSSSQ